MSSSFNLEEVRKKFSDPIIGKIASFSKRIAKLESDNIEIEKDDLTGYGDSDHTKIWYNDNWNFAKRHAKKYDYVLLDGNNDWVDLGAQTTLWSRSLQKFSMSCWVMPYTITATPWSNTAWITDENDILGFGFDNTPRVYGEVTNDGYTTFANVALNLSSTQINRWYHLLMIYDALLPSANLKFYVDGDLIGTANYVNKTLNILSTKKMLLGHFEDDGPTINNLNGRVRDFRWWNSVLTNTDALNVYLNKSSAPTPDYWLPLYAVSSGNPIDSISGTLQGSLTNGASFPDRVEPKLPFEPDYNLFALDLRYETPNEKLLDYSGKQNIEKGGSRGAAWIYGEPCPTTGSEVFYRGGSKRNTGWKFNQADEVYLKIYDTEDNLNEFEFGEEITRTDLRMLGKTVGFSWIFRFNLASLALSNGASETFVEHYDDGSNAYSIRVGDDGNLKMIIDRAGVEYKLRTTNNIIQPNKDLEIVVTYAISGNVIKFYVNGIEDTSTATSTEVFSTFDVGDTFFFCRVPTVGDIPSKGFCDFNYIDLTRMYSEKVLTASEVANHYRNKFTISNIDEGQVCILDACVTDQLTTEYSFSPTSFTSTSYHTGP